jgi:hypothetical protein
MEDVDVVVLVQIGEGPAQFAINMINGASDAWTAKTDRVTPHHPWSGETVSLCTVQGNYQRSAPARVFWDARVKVLRFEGIGRFVPIDPTAQGGPLPPVRSGPLIVRSGRRAEQGGCSG